MHELIGGLIILRYAKKKYEEDNKIMAKRISTLRTKLLLLIFSISGELSNNLIEINYTPR